MKGGKEVRAYYHGQMSVACPVYEGQTSLGSATDANVNMERNPKDSVVCGGKVYVKGARVEPPMQPAEVSHLYRSSGVQLVCASCVPKFKLPCPRASLVFSWRQVAALPRLGRRGDPFLQRGSESVSLFHLFHLFIDWSGTGGSSLGVGVVVGFFLNNAALVITTVAVT